MIKHDALILDGKNILGRSIITRYGVQDEIETLTANIEDLLSMKKVEYVVIVGRCSVREYHQLARGGFNA